jgi:hypothetical protein
MTKFKLLLMSLLAVMCWQSIAAPVTFDAPIKVKTADQEYVLNWNDDKIQYFTHGQKNEVLRNVCNKNAFNALKDFIQSGLNESHSKFAVGSSINKKAKSTFDYEILAQNPQPYFVAMNSSVGRFLKNFPTKFSLFKSESDKECSKK